MKPKPKPKPKPKEFAVNEFLSVKLIGEGTSIFVNNEWFIQCKRLLISVPTDRIHYVDEIESIDEAADILGWASDGQKGVEYNIDLENEFWGHCSNLQAWYENEYDTRLLHSNLAFPLLKKLVKAGDFKAKKVFKEEIAKRLESGYPPVIEYLIQESYTQYLTHEELLFAVLVPKEAKILLEIENYLSEIGKEHFDLVNVLELELTPCFTVKNRHVIEIGLFNSGLGFLPESIGELRFLECLNLRDNKLSEIPKSITNLKELKLLDLSYNGLNLSKDLLAKLREGKTFYW